MYFSFMIRVFYIIFIILVATSCSVKPIDNYHGVAFLEKKQKKLLINKSNKNDIVKILGAPSTESILEDNLWIYIENRKSKSSLFKLGKEIILTNNVLMLEINNNGILKNKKFYNINDMEKLKIVEAKTEVGFKRNSFIYNFMSSMRQKVNDPLGQRAKKRKEIRKR